MIGGYIILALVDSDWNVKLRKEDIKKTEKSRGKPAEQMTEEELYASMRQLTIKEFELTPEDKVVIDAKPNFSFSQYGTPLQAMKTSLVTAE